MADEGVLRRVEYLYDPVTPKAIDAVRLRYEAGDWLVTVGDESEIELRPTDPDGMLEEWRAVEATTFSPWAAAVGKHVRWAWVLENQQGYEDGLQLGFFEPEHGGSVDIQLIALNTELRVHSVLAHETPFLS